MRIPQDDWHDPTETVKAGNVVLVQDDTPCMNWKLVVTERLIGGNDRLVRRVHIRAMQGRTNRLISKPCPLEMSSDEPQTDHVMEMDSETSAAEED